MSTTFGVRSVSLFPVSSRSPWRPRHFFFFFLQRSPSSAVKTSDSPPRLPQGSFRGALSPGPQKASATSPRKRGPENAVVHFFRTIVSSVKKTQPPCPRRGGPAGFSAPVSRFSVINSSSGDPRPPKVQGESLMSGSEPFNIPLELIVVSVTKLNPRVVEYCRFPTLSSVLLLTNVPDPPRHTTGPPLPIVPLH